MADDSNPLSQFASWQTVMLLSAVMGWGSWFSSSGYFDARPKSADVKINGAVDDQDITSRLWEDPLAATAVQVEQLKSGWESDYDLWLKLPQLIRDNTPPPLPNLDDLRGQIKYYAAHDNICILPVMVDGAPYADNVESRLRTRMALLDAFNYEGYMPSDRSHLGVAWTSWPRNVAFLSNRQLLFDHPALAQLELPPNPLPHDFDPDQFRHDLALPGLVIPYEWYQADDINYTKPPYDRILVLWLNEDDFIDYPLTRLALLFDKLGITPDQILKKQDKSGPHLTDIKLIGPHSSSCLEAMNQELEQFYNDPAPPAAINALQGLTIYSPSATIADGFLEPLLDTPGANQQSSTAPQAKVQPVRDKLTRRFQKNLISFYNFTCTDEQLAEALLHELSLRGALWYPQGINTRRPRLVLISDWDTTYGRALPATFVAKLAQWPVPAPDFLLTLGRWVQNTLRLPLPITLTPLPNDWPGRLTIDDLVDTSLHNYICPDASIIRSSFLLGVDGLTAAQTQETAANSPPANETASPRQPIERPEGTQQLDYLRRMAQSLASALSGSNQNAWPRSNAPDAVGILGGDVYDKLLILQAIRAKFPDTLFFTTDLDARLLEPSQQAWARNLIIASSYGLEGNTTTYGPRDLKTLETRTYAPFRDSYQNALYHAAKFALENEPRSALPVPQPHIFEVGRTGPIELPNADPSNPGPPSASPNFLWRIFCINFLLGCAMVLLIMSPLRIESRTLVYTIFFPAFIVVCAVLFALWTLPHDGLRLEPFYLYEGVSIWPTEILRFLAFVLTLCGIGDLFKRLQEINHAARCKYFLTAYGKKIPNPVNILRFLEFVFITPLCRTSVIRRLLFWFSPVYYKHLLRFYRQFQSPPSPEPFEPDARPVDVNDYIWNIYRAHTKPWSLFWRSLFHTFIFFLLVAITVVCFTGTPRVPARGLSSFLADWLIWSTSLTGVVFLNLFILNVSRVSNWLIRELSRAPIIWPLKLYAEAQVNLPVPKEILSDWLSVQFIANHTEVLGTLVYYPFLILLLFALAHYPVFAPWSYPPVFVAVFLYNFVIAIYTAISMERAAAKTREVILKRLNDRRVFVGSQIAAATGKPMKNPTLKEIIDQVKNLRRGAFLRFTQKPWVGALLIPLGGTGLIQLIQFVQQS
jgi:hypothetical protein